MKYRAGMDVGEKRRPQSGAMQYAFENGKVIDLRLSLMTNYQMQSSMVVRLLHVSRSQEHENGFITLSPLEMARLERYLQRKSGLILFSGPVGSGKSTTMYELLRRRVGNENLQVMTMEEPVEIHEPRFLQMEVNEKAGINYDLLIKSALRHHPDVMLIGEIRDEETAKMVIRGSLTGHLMLATVHAKDCAGVVARLVELGVSRNLLEQTLIAIVAQRLLPLYCPLCRGDCCIECTHIPLGHKRGTVMDIASEERLRRLLRLGEEQVGWEQTLNRKLRKSYALGYLSEKTLYRYALP